MSVRAHSFLSINIKITMNKKPRLFLYTSIFILTIINCYSQSAENEAKDYFNQFLNSKAQFELISKSLPTLDQCQMVFKNEYASEYFDYMSKFKEEIKEYSQKIELEKHIDCKVETINTSSLNDTKTSNMNEYSHVFKPNITFYRLTYILKNGEESVRSLYKYFVNADNKWLFFPNPAIVFRN